MSFKGGGGVCLGACEHALSRKNTSTAYENNVLAFYVNNLQKVSCQFGSVVIIFSFVLYSVPTFKNNGMLLWHHFYTQIKNLHKYNGVVV